MALIKCTECGKEFSDKASACPNCGCPTEEIKKALGETTQEEVVQEVEVQPEIVEQPVEEKIEEVVVAEPKKGPNKKIVIGVVAAVVALGAIYFVATGNSRNYSKAMNLLDSKNYSDAEVIFKDLGDYENSEEMVKECEYQIAKKDFSKEKYEDAKKIFKALGSYKDAPKLLEDCEYELSVDGQFMNALSKGLMERWDENENTTLAESDSLKKCCEIELNHVESFYDKEFNNPELQKDAQTYIDYVRKAKEALKFYTTNYTEYSTRWNSIYANRTILLHKMVDTYGLKVDKKHQKTLDDILVDASAASEEKEIKKSVLDMCKKFTFDVTDDGWGYKTYKLNMKNTTDLTFEYFSVEVNFLDASGNIVETGSGGNLNNWKPGQSASSDFWVNDSKLNIDNYDIEYIPHYSTGGIFE